MTKEIKRDVKIVLELEYYKQVCEERSQFCRERDEARAEVERLTAVNERLKADLVSQREGRASALRDVAERQREACALWLMDAARKGLEQAPFGPDEVELARQIIRICRATPLVTEGGK